MRHIVLLLASAVVLAACASPEPRAAMSTAWHANLVTALGNDAPGDIREVSDRFTFSGRIHAHATLVAEGPVAPTTTTFTMKWFQGERLIHERSSSQVLTQSPYYLVHALPGSVLGVGVFRVELHSEVGRLASREFTVSER